MGKVIKTIDFAERLWALILLLAILLIMTLQIFCRYVLDSPLNWPEELAVLLACYLTFVGVSLVHRAHGHMAFSLLIDRLPSSFKVCADYLINISTIIIFVVIAYTSIGLQKMQANFLYFAALPIAKNFFTLPITICSISVIINCLYFVLKPSPGDT